MGYRVGVIGLMLSVFIVAALVGSEQGEQRAVEAGKNDSLFDYVPYASLLEAHVDPQGRVDYGALKADPARLDAFVDALARLRPERYAAWSAAERCAFWINAYNGLTIKAVVEHFPIRPGGLLSFRYPANSIRQIPGVWDRLAWAVMGESRTLDAIEHEVLRKEFAEPRIHMAIVCASVGCPKLLDVPYRGDTLDAQLGAQSRRFLGEGEKFRVDKAEGKVYLSPLFDWFGEDFVAGYGTKGYGKHGESERAVLHFAGAHVDGELGAWLRAGDYDVAWLPYDWALNGQ